MVFQKGSNAKVFIANSRSSRKARLDDKLWSQGSRVFILKAKCCVQCTHCTSTSDLEFSRVFSSSCVHHQTRCKIVAPCPKVPPWSVQMCSTLQGTLWKSSSSLLAHFELCRMGTFFKYFQFFQIFSNVQHITMHIMKEQQQPFGTFWTVLKFVDWDFFLNIFKCATYFRLQCFFHYYAGQEALEEATWYLSESVCQQKHSPLIWMIPLSLHICVQEKLWQM